jgi:hypothetical protein
MGLSEMTAFSLRSKFVNESTEAQNPIALSDEASDLSTQKNRNQHNCGFLITLNSDMPIQFIQIVLTKLFYVVHTPLN